MRKWSWCIPDRTPYVTAEGAGRSVAVETGPDEGWNWCGMNSTDKWRQRRQQDAPGRWCGMRVAGSEVRTWWPTWWDNHHPAFTEPAVMDSEQADGTFSLFLKSQLSMQGYRSAVVNFMCQLSWAKQGSMWIMKCSFVQWYIKMKISNISTPQSELISQVFNRKSKLWKTYNVGFCLYKFESV